MADKPEQPRPDDADELQGVAYPLLSLSVFLVTAVFAGAELTLHALPYFGIDPQMKLSAAQALIGLPCILIQLVVSFYCGVIAWLVFAKILFTRRQVLSVVCLGTHSRFDLWLVDRFFAAVED